jgi:hypothetical protein
MASTSRETRVLLAGDGGAGAVASGLNLHAIAPILIGLAAPVIVLSLMSPAFLAHARFLILALLCGLFLVATVLFAMSLLLHGPLSALSIDTEGRAIELVYSGMFANKGVQIPFSDIASLKLTTHYDDDGYRFAAPELVLRNGSRMLLPIAASEMELQAARRLIGLV